MRRRTYAQAIREAHADLLRQDPRVFVCGQGVWNPWYAGTSLQDLDKEFGRERVFDCPVSENATTGAAIGAAIVGMRPIVFHARMDFMLLAVDPIVNQAANWSYLFGGQVNVPVVIRSVINRGGEQGAQHSQALQALFAHVPGLKVVMPATPHDAKGLLIAAVRDGNPVLYIDDRWLYEQEGDVPEGLYEVPIGAAAIRRPGKDVTLVATSYMAAEAAKAVEQLAERDIDVELIDLRTIKPWDRNLLYSSVGKTGRLVIADAAWMSGGIAADIAASVAGDLFHALKAPIGRVCLPDVPAPTSAPLERAYYVGAEDIVATVEKVLL
ncbi:MAG: Acetoin:2,6-dichlorophenolindophenol oxidoreductase subunit beta [Nitrospirae bacterium]|nr:MAG: transketolase [Nitrospira sp. OLB3]MBV6471150.1 Acetoin:2,6-dichlorophenolindophenol oxidoreductase subunit beta [Nitrospirota bacterium]MCE7966718.1 alpha-ketoacid dehydrogenase subunit beta [Nitrospira sp. NTP2]MCK6493954.1 alpha-ketoacid dehydrogenase subunit beta [Nitrospira sp.]RIK57184.1 MAG: alpha-ketoacid dehydrogenase subunit beta [Nitrospira sp.]